VSGGSTHHLVTLLKYSFIGLIGGAVLVAFVAILVSGPSSFFSTKSSWLGTEKDWARGILLYLAIRGAIFGLVLGLVAGVFRVLVLSRRR
jgi:hypothetical protein